MHETLTSFNPSTGEPVGEVPITPASVIHATVDIAHKAGAEWRKVSPEARAGLLKRAGAALVEGAEMYGNLLSREMGKPLKFGIREVTYCGGWIPHKVDEIVEALEPQTSVSGSIESTIYFDPLGVCGVISPWNYPMSMPQWMVIPALMAGNSVVLKPSEETPLTGQIYASVLNEFLPEGVLQVIHGADTVGRELVDSDVNMIAFTGSRNTGINIMRSAAKGVKRLVLELGGKDPLIVLADADVEGAAGFAVDNCFENSGQMCISTERIYVHSDIAEGFEHTVAELASGLRVGSWDDPDADLGPMINSRQREHVIAQIRDAVDRGARVLCGGTDHPERFVLPTVLAGVTDDMQIMREETFGPVACISRFSDTDVVVSRANDSVYGLGAVVFGRDVENARGVARRIDAGMIGVNKSCFGTPDSPWVGAKQSGHGFHGSADGHRQFAQTRVLSRTIAAPDGL